MIWRWFCNAYVQIAFGSLTVTASELLMKCGANAQAGAIGVFGFSAMGSAWTWAGIVLYCISFVSWVSVLQKLPLAIAYGLINIVHVLIPLGCWIFLHEVISTQRWSGIAIVLIGMLLIAKPAAQVEQKLEARL